MIDNSKTNDNFKIPVNISIYKELERRIIDMEYKPGDAISEKN
ncbi:hypothetical protein [Clostridium sp. DL1XJH146]